jgi:hypothetical protein
LLPHPHISQTTTLPKTARRPHKRKIHSAQKVWADVECEVLFLVS